MWTRDFDPLFAACLPVDVTLWVYEFARAHVCVCVYVCTYLCFCLSWAALLLLLLLPWHLAMAETKLRLALTLTLSVSLSLAYWAFSQPSWAPSSQPSSYQFSDRCGNSVNCGRCSQTDARHNLQNIHNIHIRFIYISNTNTILEHLWLPLRCVSRVKVNCHCHWHWNLNWMWH